MKILAIRGKNLASLAGEFEVDFTSEPLRSTGIFAITGSTGSGKSTLLDALCLALFDTTPRTAKAREARVELADIANKTIAQSDCRSVLRRGTGEGYAEVDFVALSGKVYRSTWIATRTGKRPMGALRTTVLRLLNLTDNQEETGTKKELLAQITTLIGLSFEQFNRSVLLAQGDFALFLKAKQGEKAEILEKLTGTGIYSRISTAIYVATRTAESDYRLAKERMSHIELLPDDALHALEAEAGTLATRLTTHTQEETAITTALKWFADRRILLRNRQLAADEQAAARSAMEQAAPRYELLQRLEQAQAIRDTFFQARTVRLQLAQAQAALQQQQQQIAQLQARHRQLDDAATTAEQEHAAFCRRLAELEPLLDQAKALDVRIAAGQKTYHDACKEQTAAATHRRELEQALATARKEQEKLQQQLKRLEEWFEHYRAYAGLVPAIELVTNMLANWETARKQAALHRKTLAEATALYQTEQERLQAVQAEAERLNHLLPAEVVVLRKQLQEGTPCPVCGSLHHPLATQTEVQALQEAELERAKQQATAENERLTNAVNNCRVEIARLEAVAANYERQATETLARVTAYVSVLPRWEELLGQGKLRNALQRFGQQWDNSLREQDKARSLLAAIGERLESLKRETQNQVQRCREQDNKRQTLEQELARCTAERARLLNGQATAEVTAANQTHLQRLEQQRTQATQARQTILITLESARGKAAQLTQEQTRLAATAEAEDRKLEAWLLAHRTAIGSPAELEALLTKDTAWLAREKKALEELKLRLASAEAVLAERQRSLAAHDALPGRPQATEDAEQQLAERLARCREAKEQDTARRASIRLQLETQEKNRRQLATLRRELEEQETRYNNWAKLNELFGSMNGSKFKEIAQAYTLDVLMLYANRHLQELAPRYELQRISGTLALQIADLDMLGEVRSVHSLSGGESFLVSLALALGLSSLSSNRMHVESLFIDEGFGSLDTDTLRIAMDALERLQVQGRKIGVISHVTDMTERIPVRIQVVKAGSGRSRIVLPGCDTE